jgi:hypothetical protein
MLMAQLLTFRHPSAGFSLWGLLIPARGAGMAHTAA